MLITLYFYYKTKPYTFQPFFLNQHLTQVYDQFLQNIVFQTSNDTYLLYAQLPHQSSRVCQKHSHLESLEETTVSIRNRFPQNDPVSHIQKDLHVLTIILRSVLDQISLVYDPEVTQLFIFCQFLQY